MKNYFKFEKIYFVAFSIVALFFLQSFSTVSITEKDTVEAIEKDTVYYNESEHVLSEEQKKIIPSYAYYNRNAKKYRVVGIGKTPNETFVDYVIVPRSTTVWSSISENTYLRDRKTGDMYKIRRVEKGIPLGQVLVINERRNRYVCFTLVFPPLPPSVKVVDLVEEPSRKVVYSDNMGRDNLWYDRGLKIKKFQKIRSSSPKIIE